MDAVFIINNSLIIIIIIIVINRTLQWFYKPCVCAKRINGHLVALKVIRMKTEEGVPFTAIREGKWFCKQIYTIKQTNLTCVRNKKD